MKRILPCSFFQAHARSLGLDSSHNLLPKKSSILSLKILCDSQGILAFVNTCLFCAWGLAVLDHLIWTSVEVPVSRWHRCSRTWWPCYCSHLTRCYLWRVPWPWNHYKLWAFVSGIDTLLRISDEMPFVSCGQVSYVGSLAGVQLRLAILLQCNYCILDRGKNVKWW